MSYAKEVHTDTLRRHWNPIYVLSNVLFYCFYYPCMRSSRPRWVPSFDVWLQKHGREDRPFIFYSWHGNSWWLIAAVAQLPRSHRPTGISNDGPLSRMNSWASSWLGIDMFEYRRNGADSPRDQIAAYVRESGRSIMIFPDAGGPYRRLKRGVLAIARETGSCLVPVVLTAKPELVVGATMRHLVPVPFASLRVALGDPLPPTGAGVDDLERALLSLEKSTIGR